MYIFLFIILILVLALGYTTYINSLNAWSSTTPAQTEAFNQQYARFGDMYSAPLFEPGILRRCAEGSYMYTDDPALTDFCSTVPSSVLDKVACHRAYHGRPLHMSYTTPSQACGCQPTLRLN